MTTCATSRQETISWPVWSDRRGFTLVELSIVLVILGLIIGSVAPLIISMTKRNKLTAGKKIVQTARNELQGEIFRTRTVPADLTAVGHNVDPWGNPLVYIPAPALTGQDICTWLAGGTGQTQLAVCLDGDCATGKRTNVAFVIASIGSNFNRQLETARHLDADGSDLEVRLYTYGTQTDLYTVAPDPNRATDQFDDIVEYVTVAELLQQVTCEALISNQTGSTVCLGSTKIVNGADIAVLQYNQSVVIGATGDDCATISDTCSRSFAQVMILDGNRDGRVQLTAPPPACTINDI